VGKSAVPAGGARGEIKLYLDGDKQFPTICRHGTEDYFCGSYNFENQQTHRYQTFSTPYSGLAQVLPPEGNLPARPTLWVVPLAYCRSDPLRERLKVTIQALGWQSGGRYLPLEDDIASMAYWYQAEPHAKFPPLPKAADLIVSHCDC